ncbi:MAG: bifunctional riboflavin kinase/FAD synthetase [Gammaproteobacteria bacterium]|nr:bifunctional riboflavin kinase/FAD synthetase [Gammaproteobacteria bacterium]MBQ0774801.1 bifunctional riboflavin kinase/FAD synthetase [Gammaproteobacteria bacterium]
MELIRGLHNLRPRHRGCVATIGNFDGVHRGHQRILEQVLELAEARNLKSAVMLFEPQPQEFFAPDTAPPRLMTLRDKVRALAAAGVDQVLCCRFDDAFRCQSAEHFVQRILVDGLGVEHLVVGDDFRFGAGREGDFTYLQRAGQTHGFAVTDTPTCARDDERVSSTRIRAVLQQGDLAQAQALLGRPYRISGRVRHGAKLGRQLNTPTANLAMRHVQSPVAGVYSVRVSGAGLSQAPGVANVGTRPTVNGTDNRLEVHLLDYNGDLYGQYLEVEFLQFQREEKKFDGLDALKVAIQQDIDHARTFFGIHKD